MTWTPPLSPGGRVWLSAEEGLGQQPDYEAHEVGGTHKSDDGVRLGRLHDEHRETQPGEHRMGEDAETRAEDDLERPASITGDALGAHQREAGAWRHHQGRHGEEEPDE